MSSGYRSGFEAVAQAAERMQSGGNFSGPQTRMIGWNAKEENGDKKYIRLLDDSPIVIGVHAWTPCIDGKKRDFICAQELADPRPCIICDTHKRKNSNGEEVPVRPSTVGLGLAALREEVREGRTVTTQDILVDIDVPDDEEKVDLIKEAGYKVEGGMVKNVPDVGIIRQSVGNFWSNFNAYYARYGTVVDRDYEIMRQGEKINTKYVIIPFDRDDEMGTQEEVDDHYAVSKILRTGLVEYIERLGSEQYYNKHLVPGGNQTSSTSGSSREVEEEVEEEVKNDTEFSNSLRDKLRNYSSKN